MAAMLTAARTAMRRQWRLGVRIPCIVEGVCELAGRRVGCGSAGLLPNLVRCSPELLRNAEK
ncbi:Uncharacterised protein [Mycobacterium tuberculosis]|nr:Uncharacterised protein [Mycobacterium tuberculosis]